MKFATLTNFTEQGIRNIGETTHRAAQFREMARNSGLIISEMLWLNGRFDGLLIYEAPDLETATALMMRLLQAGNVTTETLSAFDAAGMQDVLVKSS